MKDKEKFCRSFEWKIDIGWFDLTGYVPIGQTRRAKIELTDSSSNHYGSFTVTIINRIEGMVDKKRFSFDDYLDRSMEARKDQRSDYPLGRNACFHAWKSEDLEWYIAVPKTTRAICEAIEKYIGVFK